MVRQVGKRIRPRPNQPHGHIRLAWHTSKRSAGFVGVDLTTLTAGLAFIRGSVATSQIVTIARARTVRKPWPHGRHSSNCAEVAARVCSPPSGSSVAGFEGVAKQSSPAASARSACPLDCERISKKEKENRRRHLAASIAQFRRRPGAWSVRPRHPPRAGLHPRSRSIRPLRAMLRDPRSAFLEASR